MKTFKEFLKLQEDLWNTAGPQDNPSNPGNKRKNAKALYNHRYDGTSGGTTSSAPAQLPQAKK